jgi:hypothetical protein
MTWTLKITKAMNGYIVEHGDEREVEVIGEPEALGWSSLDYKNAESKNNSESAVTLAWYMWDYFNLRGHKTDKYRPHAEIEQGHCYIDPEDKEDDD